MLDCFINKKKLQLNFHVEWITSIQMEEEKINIGRTTAIR